MDARLSAALTAGKASALATRVLGRGGGTALPGLVAERVDPAAAAKLARQLGGGRVLVTGTNGKTTTARVLAAILTEAGIPAVHNREGSNLMRGILSTLVAAAGVSGRIKRGDALAGLFETDEATLPAASRALAPRAIVFTNLFRDQLDRYGEVETVAALWREALAAAPRDCTLVLNADDPSVAELALDWDGPVHWFGLDDDHLADAARSTQHAALASDARWCRACGGSFAYERRYFAHAGWWRCDGCGRARPTPDTVATDVRLALDTATFSIAGLGEVTMPLTGAYNVWNAAAAVAAARVLGVNGGAIRRGIAGAQAAFGRQEVVEIDGRRLRLLLVKNPAGANQVLSLLAALDRELAIAALLNDRFADGRDVSWVWDVDFELLCGRVTVCWAGGDRAEDMALRLKYAGWPPATAVPREPGALLDAVLAGAPAGGDAFVLATYTAMLDLRRELGRRGAATAFWRM